MGITSSMYTAITGLNMAQAGMEVASHNIANVNTPGYSRQRLNLETTPTYQPGNYGQMGTGVSAQNITRFHDEFLTRSLVEKSSEYGSAVARKSAIDTLESCFNESSGNGINEAMNDFWAAWDSLADGSDLSSTRTELVSLAQTLAGQVSARRDDLDSLRQELNSRLESSVSDVNSIINTIASLNEQIMRSESSALNQEANDLRDTRDSLLIQLGEYMDIDYWEDPSTGTLNISLSSGPALVSNTTAYEMGASVDQNGDVRIIANNRRTSPPWPEDVTDKISGGAIGGWVDFRDNDLKSLDSQYESFVDNLIFQVNNQHAQGVGLDLYTDITSTSNISNHPSAEFSFGSDDSGIKLTALVNHQTAREPYSAINDPDNISVRFVKSDKVTNEISSTVVWNEKADGGGKWEISVVLPTDSNGNVTATADDVIEYINSETSPTAASGVPSLPPLTTSGSYKIGDFISAESIAGSSGRGAISFNGKAYPSGDGAYSSLDRSLANMAGLGHHLSYGYENAQLDTTLAGTDNDVVFKAAQSGAAGENIAIEYVTPNGAEQPLGVSVSTDLDGTRRITVSLGTDANGSVTTTAGDIVDLINKDYATRDLVYAETPSDQTGQGVVGSMDKTYLDRSGSFEIVTYDDEGEASIHRITVDPTDTLQDVVKRIGTSFSDGVPGLRAEVLTDKNGNETIRLIADSESGIEFGFRNDTSGALAVLGLNNIFSGDSSSNIGVNQLLVDNPGLLGAGKISSDGARADGDNTNALDMADIKDQRYTFSDLSSATLSTAFNTFYSNIGAINNSITTEYEFTSGILENLNDQQDSLAGVNLDEELSDVLKYQYMYQAAAKIVTIIDEMMETLLAMR
ncbi:flagellar hook-associated protein FlgK [Deltaproteobacteria bacterium Smac51]|nr:flagellar hook-associated protein FlgK [Deltaproteobacteria bacterium Smac51]